MAALPRCLRLVMSLCLVVFLFAAGSASAQDATSDLLGRINSLRNARGLPPYSLNGALTAAASSQAQWMIANNCAVAHTHPDGSNPRSRALASGYTTADVSENIYCGTNATTDSAWTFWVNSSIHYAGLVNTRYKEIGIASAQGAPGTSFVLVFGNPGGPDYVPPAPAGSGNRPGGAPQQPSYVVGLDEFGNIKHEIQEGDTLGQIALIYGYTWADIPAILALNGLTEADYRGLKVGTIILVPPKAGTYTPTPGDPLAATPTAEPPTDQPSPTPELPTVTPTALPVPTRAAIATANAVPAALILPSATPQSAATASTPIPTLIRVTTETASSPFSSGTSPWLAAALIVQVGILLGAGIEFLRRSRRR
jgi:hypothetical protein